MSEFIKVLFSVSLSGSVLMILIIIMKALFCGRLSAKWHYYIWLLVIVRLLVFVSPWQGAAGLLFLVSPQAVYRFDTSQSESGKGTKQDENSIMEADFTGAIPKKQTAASAAEEEQQNNVAFWPQLSMIWKGVLAWIWIPWAIIAIAYFIRKVTIYQSFQKYICAGRQEPDDPDILNLYSDVCERLSIRKVPRFYTNSLIASPIFTGFLHPCVFLPGVPQDEEELELILMHELTHYKHRDTWMIWIVQFTLALHWFNPLVHYMAARIRQDREFACDAAVIGILRKEQHHTYGRVLIKSLEHSGTYRESVVSVALHESAAMLKQRLEAIDGGVIRHKKADLLPLGLTAVICLAGLAIGTYRPQNTEPVVSVNTGSREGPADADKKTVQGPESADHRFEFSAAEVVRIDLSGISGEVKLSGQETEQITVTWDEGNAVCPALDGGTLAVRGNDEFDELITIVIPLSSQKPISVSILAEDGKFLLQNIGLDNLTLVMEGGSADVFDARIGHLDIESSGADLSLTDCRISGEFIYTGSTAGFKANRLEAGSCLINNDMGVFTWKEGAIAAAAEFEQDSGGEMTLTQLRADHMVVGNELGELKITDCTARAAELDNESLLEVKLLNADNLVLTQKTGRMELKQIRVAGDLGAEVEFGSIQLTADIEGNVNLCSRQLGKLDLTLDTPRAMWNISAHSIYENTLGAFFLDQVMMQYPYLEDGQKPNTLTITDENSVGQFIHIRFNQK